jgi:hypothetical protein
MYKRGVVRVPEVERSKKLALIVKVTPPPIAGQPSYQFFGKKTPKPVSSIEHPLAPSEEKSVKNRAVQRIPLKVAQKSEYRTLLA